MSRRPFIAGNWKMHGNRASIAELLTALAQARFHAEMIDIAVFPPFVYLDQALAALGQTTIAVGAQTVCREEQGAFTGEVAASQLHDVGCRYVLIGHSERRQFFGETDAIVVKKCQRALGAGLVPVVCVGETLQEREQQQTEAVVARQIDAVLNAITDITALNRLVIAYEPVWAIGTGLTATPEQANDIHAFLRTRVAKIAKNCAEKLKILYGGSVKADNIALLLAQPDVDGGLVGGASLSAPEFLKIIDIVSHCATTPEMSTNAH